MSTMQQGFVRLVESSFTAEAVTCARLGTAVVRAASLGSAPKPVAVKSQ